MNEREKEKGRKKEYVSVCVYERDIVYMRVAESGVGVEERKRVGVCMREIVCV